MAKIWCLLCSIMRCPVEMRQMKTYETQDNGEIRFPKDIERDENLSKYQQIHLREEKRNTHLDNGNKQYL